MATSPLTYLEAGAGFVLILFFLLFFLLRARHAFPRSQSVPVWVGINIGLGTGLLWTAEICINNVLTPPLPARDIIDDCFWGLIALILVIGAIQQAYLQGKATAGIRAGLWGGTASGVIACLTALLMIFLGMSLITRDPLNVIEWNAVINRPPVPSMAQYFAFETFAGAILHLTLLGPVMGLLLGILGGFLGALVKTITSRWGSQLH